MQKTIELIDDDQDEITDKFLPFLHAKLILACQVVIITKPSASEAGKI